MTDERMVRAVLWRVADLEADAKAILATHEASSARVITLEASYSKLDQLSLAQDELFRESLRAVQNELYRAAHVLAWAGFIDFLHNVLVTDHAAALAAARPNWNIQGPEDLREFSDFEVIRTGKVAQVYGNTMMRTLHGLLGRRNECAHPSAYFPDLNMTLGYISDLIDRIRRLSS
jgi:hypothetical protein